MEIRVKDLEIFYGVSSRTAQRRMNEICDFFHCRTLTVWHLSQYEAVPISVIKSILRCCE